VSLVLVLVGLATGVSTFAGGLLALALKHRTYVILGLSAGAIVGVAVLELAPEALRTADQAYAVVQTSVFMALGFIGYLAIDRGLLAAGGRISAHRAHIGPGSLTLHSLLDGLAIGLAFHASAAIGLSVAVAVIAHDLSDGVNTVNLSLTGGSSPSVARWWLSADALAPMLGILLARLVSIPHGAFPPVLAALAGGLLYVGVGNLVATRRRHRPGPWTILAPALGFGFIYGIARLSQV
jgi:zinc transporter ZupT